MTRTRKVVLAALTATVAVAAVAFAQAKAKMDAAAPAVGAPAPAYSLPDQDGKVRTSAENAGKITLLAFYPADFTGGCTLEAHSLSGSYKDLAAQGVQVYGVSVQDPKSHKSFCTTEGIPYTLLADTSKKMAADYGVLIPGAGIANRVTYIIGADGKVAYVDKDVNSHLTTCGDDWAAWVKAHPQIKTASVPASPELQTVSLKSGAVSLKSGAESAPKFSLPEVTTGAQTSLAALGQGKKATVVMFISTQCPYSNAYNDRMTALAKKYGAAGIAFVGIDSNQTEPTAEVAAFAKAKGFPFPVLKDEGDKTADAYAARVTPETYVVDSKGVLVYHGRIDNDMDPANVKTHDLADALDAVLAGKTIAKAQTKAFGCSIKRG